MSGVSSSVPLPISICSAFVADFKSSSIPLISIFVSITNFFTGVFIDVFISDFFFLIAASIATAASPACSAFSLTAGISGHFDMCTLGYFSCSFRYKW